MGISTAPSEGEVGGGVEEERGSRFRVRKMAIRAYLYYNPNLVHVSHYMPMHQTVKLYYSRVIRVFLFESEPSMFYVGVIISSMQKLK